MFLNVAPKLLEETIRLEPHITSANSPSNLRTEPHPQIYGTKPRPQNLPTEPHEPTPPQEFATGVEKRLKVKVAPKLLEEIIRRADADRDGRLSYQAPPDPSTDLFGPHQSARFHHIKSKAFFYLSLCLSDSRVAGYHRSFCSTSGQCQPPLPSKTAAPTPSPPSSSASFFYRLASHSSHCSTGDGTRKILRGEQSFMFPCVHNVCTLPLWVSGDEADLEEELA